MATAIEQDLPFVMTCDAVESDIVDTDPSGDDAGEGEPMPNVDVSDAAPEPFPIRGEGETVTIRRIFHVVPENVKDEDQDALAKDEAVALDEKFHVATTFAECKAKNKFRCRYHGTAAMQDSIKKFFAAKGIGNLDPKIKPFDLSDKDNLAYQFEVTCQKNQEKAVLSALKAFAKASKCIKLMAPDKAIKDEGSDKYAFFKVDYFDKDCKDPKEDAAPNEAEAEEEAGVENPEEEGESGQEDDNKETSPKAESEEPQKEDKENVEVPAKETVPANETDEPLPDEPLPPKEQPAAVENEADKDATTTQTEAGSSEEGGEAKKPAKKPKKTKKPTGNAKAELDEPTAGIFAKCDKLESPNPDIAETKASILDLVQKKKDAEKNVAEAKSVAKQMETLAKSNPLIKTVLDVANNNIKMTEQTLGETDSELKRATEKLSSLADKQLKEQNELTKKSIDDATENKKEELAEFLKGHGLGDCNLVSEMVDKIVHSALGGDADPNIKEKAIKECGIEEDTMNLEKSAGTFAEALSSVYDYLGKDEVTKENGAALVDKLGTIVEAVKTGVLAVEGKKASLKRKFDALKKVKEAEAATAAQNNKTKKKSALQNVINKLQVQYKDKDNLLTPSQKTAIGKKLAWLMGMAAKNIG